MQPTEIKNKKNVYVGIYARVSTDFDSQKLSAEHQVQMLSDLAVIRGEREDENWIVLPEHIYEDEDVSGKKVSILQRPAISRMVQDIQEGHISIVLFKGISRFSRDQQDGITLYNQLTQRYRVRVISEEENYDSKYADSSFWFGFHLLMAQFESDKIATRVSLGLRQKAKNGKWPTQMPPYGYDIDKETKKLIPNEKRKAIETIFKQYVDGLGIRSVAEYMNTNTPYKPTFAQYWSSTMIRRILVNQAYLGHVEYNKTSLTVATNDEGIKKPMRHKNDPEKVIRVEDAHPAIIEQSLFDQTQTKLARNSYNRSLPVAKSPLGGILRCGRCGKPMIRTGNFQPKGHIHQSSNGKMYARRKDTDLRKYACSTMHNQGKSLCDLPQVKSVDIEKYLYLELLSQLDAYVKKANSGEIENLNNDNDKNNQRLKQIDKEIERLLKASSDIVKDRELLDPETYRSILLQYKDDTSRLRQEKDLIEKEMISAAHAEGNKEFIEEKIKEIYTVDPTDQDSLRNLFQFWFDKIIMHDRGRYEVFPTVYGLGIISGS